jgi:LPPG:FO 2-phospho-L-lactate transferase
VNTGDDLRWWGLHVSPDVDSITYVLAGILSRERGWGVERDTFFCTKAMGQMGEPAWFQIGDRDLATHIFRSKLRAEGKTLSEATAEIAARLGIKGRILPMTNARVETRVLTAAGDLSFEEYFVQRGIRIQSCQCASKARPTRNRRRECWMQFSPQSLSCSRPAIR